MGKEKVIVLSNGAWLKKQTAIDMGIIKPKKERLPRKKKKEVKRDIVRWCEYYGLRVPKFTMEMLRLYYFEKL
jgi:hypothetical protein